MRHRASYLQLRNITIKKIIARYMLLLNLFQHKSKILNIKYESILFCISFVESKCIRKMFETKNITTYYIY